MKRIKAEPDQSGSGLEDDNGATDFDVGNNDDDEFDSFNQGPVSNNFLSFVDDTLSEQARVNLTVSITISHVLIFVGLDFL